jgi:hypothetical protein
MQITFKHLRKHWHNLYIFFEKRNSKFVTHSSIIRFWFSLKMREFFAWSPVTMHPKIPRRFYKRTILRSLNRAKVFTVHFIQIYLTIIFLTTTTFSTLSPLMMLFQAHSSTYLLVFLSFCLSCPFHHSHFIYLNYTKLKVTELAYVAPQRPNKSVRNLSWNRRGINFGLLWMRLWRLRLPSPWGNTANN